MIDSHATSECSMHVTTVIVTYGGRQSYCIQVIDRCLEEGADKLLIIANGVTNQARIALEEKERNCSRLHIIYLSKNEGSAGGIAAGIEFICKSDLSGMFLFLDDDNLLNKGAITTLQNTYLLESSSESSDLVLFCNRSGEFPDDARALATGRAKHFKKNGFMGFDLSDAINKRLQRASLTGGHRQDLISVDHGPWGGMFISAALLKSARRIMSEFFIYGDDLWFTHDLALNGVSMKLVREAKITDLASTYEGVTSFFSPELPDAKAYYAMRNYAYISRRLATSKLLYNMNKLLFLSYQLIRELRVSWHHFSAVLARVFLINQALKDGYAGRLGVNRRLSSLP